MFDYAANIVQRLLRQTCVFVACEQVDAVFRQRHVAVHTGAVITEHRFWHKGRGFTEAVRYVVHNIFVDLNFVSFFGHGIEAGSHFVLTSSRYFVVMGFNHQTHLFHHQTHFRTNILSRVYRRNREVTAFHCRTVTFVTTFILGGGVPCAFDIVDSNVGTGDRRSETDVIEQEEFRFWPEQYGVGNASGTQVIFSALRDGARVTVIALQGTRFKDVATDNQGRIGEERINHCGGCVWHQHHVGFVNAFPAANRGAVKHFAFFEEFSIHLMSRDSDVLFFTFGIGEAQINKLHFVLVQHRQYVFSGHTLTLLDWSWSSW